MKFEGVGNLVGGYFHKLHGAVCILRVNCADIAVGCVYAVVVVVVGGIDINASVAVVFEFEFGGICTCHEHIGAFVVALAYVFDVGKVLRAAILNRVGFAVCVLGDVPYVGFVEISIFAGISAETPEHFAVDGHHACGGVAACEEVDVVVAVGGVAFYLDNIFGVEQGICVYGNQFPNLVGVKVACVAPETAIAVVLGMYHATVSGIAFARIVKVIAYAIFANGERLGAGNESKTAARTIVGCISETSPVSLAYKVLNVVVFAVFGQSDVEHKRQVGFCNRSSCVVLCSLNAIRISGSAIKQTLTRILGGVNVIIAFFQNLGIRILHARS